MYHQFNIQSFKEVLILNNDSYYVTVGGLPVADLAMVPWVPWNPPFGLELLLRNTDDEPNGTLLSG